MRDSVFNEIGHINQLGWGRLINGIKKTSSHIE